MIRQFVGFSIILFMFFSGDLLKHFYVLRASTVVTENIPDEIRSANNENP